MKKYYHISDTKNKEFILKNGLEADNNNEIFLFTKLEQGILIATNQVSITDISYFEIDIEEGNITEIHFASLDRMGRSILDLLTMIEYFNSKSINLFVENIGMYSMIGGKPNPTFKMIASVLGNVAEMERDNMLERQKAGIELAKLQGKYKGRLYGSRMTDAEFLKKYKKVEVELQNGESLRRAAKLGECGLGVAQKVKRLMTVEV